jgi:hypothetical protein
MRAVCFDELVGNDLGAIGGAIVDDDQFPIEVTGCEGSKSAAGRSRIEEVAARQGLTTYFSVKVRLSSQVMMGRLRRSL